MFIVYQCLSNDTFDEGSKYGERTIKDLGVTPRAMEREAFNYLIRFRKGGHFIEL